MGMGIQLYANEIICQILEWCFKLKYAGSVLLKSKVRLHPRIYDSPTAHIRVAAMLKSIYYTHTII